MSASARLATSERDTSSPLADPALRLAARTLDVALPLAPFLVLAPVGVALGAPVLIRAGLVSTLVALAAVGALNLMWLHRYGQTIGKRALGLRIVRSDGQRATLGTIVARRIVAPGVLASIPLLGSVFALADALLVFSRTRQTIHDRFADTIVIDLRRGAATGATDIARVFE